MKLTSVCLGVACGILAGGMSLPATAQVTSDGTTNTVVNQSGNNFNILNGINQGNNLFHSFSNFSVPTNGSAIFDLINTPNITTIFSRVTGGNVSNIDGLIQTLNSNNPVSLFLMNPNGIMFGPNAKLDIGGSFVGTTASSIKFADGTEFSAVNPTAKPLLTMSVPVGLQMGQNPGAITVQGTGHRITGGFFAPFNRSQNPIGLQAGAGKTLALIGGDVNFGGGIATLKGSGHLEVGSVRDGQVKLNSTGTGWVGDYSAIQQFNNINLAQQSLLDGSGINSSIQVQGRNINLTEGSTVLLQNLGAQKSEGITVHARESLTLTGNTANGGLWSSIRTDNLGTSQTGDITISAAQLLLQDGGRINTTTFVAAPSGNITIDVPGSITVAGAAPARRSLNSTISTNTFSDGKAGNFTLSTSNLRLLDSAAIGSSAFRSGATGRVQINVKDLIEVAGVDEVVLAPSSLTSSTIGKGNADEIVINTARLLVRDGGFVGSIAAAEGSSSQVIINASESVVVQGKAPESITSSRISSTAQILDARTRSAFGLPDAPSGDARSLTINTPSLRITDQAYVTVKNDGSGKAGDLQINANSIFLDNEGSITASTASGDGGEVILNVQDHLLMRHNSFISATAAGNGNGGDLTINAPIIVGLENSDLIANAVKGRGGNIDITTQGIIGLAFRNTLTPRTDLTNDITASSQFSVNGTVQINNIGVDPNSGLIELPANVTDQSQQIAAGCADTSGSSFVATGRGGIPQNPNQDLRSDHSWSDIRDVSAFRKNNPVTAQIPESPEVLVQATSWHRNALGKIEIVADKSSTQMQQPLTCAAVSSS
ncbi:two-partner secretion domain-containing protein [Nostoc sp. UHCC 0870]|uniref:two-partner secretion domain-containing protein n=1 Tax=Nostoc sp. UHCC 0870 TaxID=2914041 RepID=UPI001EDFDC57|nr:S-layer family protein [Nostoc sp. UHCC 0870]UKP00476.1 S-layer family protein [Nostoc sp. UHCC 0870]